MRQAFGTLRATPPLPTLCIAGAHAASHTYHATMHASTAASTAACVPLPAPRSPPSTHRVCSMLDPHPVRHHELVVALLPDRSAAGKTEAQGKRPASASPSARGAHERRGAKHLWKLPGDLRNSEKHRPTFHHHLPSLPPGMSPTPHASCASQTGLPMGAWGKGAGCMAQGCVAQLT